MLNKRLREGLYSYVCTYVRYVKYLRMYVPPYSYVPRITYILVLVGRSTLRPQLTTLTSIATLSRLNLEAGAMGA